MFPYHKLDEGAVRAHLAAVSERDVLASLAAESPRLSDLLNLISPAAAGMLDLLRDKARSLRLRKFGKVVNLYTPLYVGNQCVNSCLYCGFRHSNDIERKNLSVEEALAEAEVIKSYGIDSILLVCGEDHKHMGADYFVELVGKLRQTFSFVAVEIYPMDYVSYRRLFEAGVHGLTLYQETYSKANYQRFHLAGPKKDYENRLARFEDGARAGFYNLGIGALLGLYDWRIEAAFLAAHGMYVKKHYWRSKLQFAFPRINPMAGGFEPPCPVSEPELEQMILAFRVVFPDADLTVSTRESAAFRDRMAVIAVNKISAGSRVKPGSYVSDSKDLAQFTLADQRSAAEVVTDIRKLGLEPVFKDWDACLGLGDIA